MKKLFFTFTILFFTCILSSYTNAQNIGDVVNPTLKDKISKTNDTTANLLPFRAIKTDLASLAAGNPNIGIEWFLQGKYSIEGNATLITNTLNANHPNVRGFCAKIGVKYYVFADAQNTQFLQGFYLKPQLTAQSYSFTDGVYEITNQYQKRSTVNALAVSLNIGKQWIIFKNIAVDLYTGAGTGISKYKNGELYSDFSANNLNKEPQTTDNKNYTSGYQYGFFTPNNAIPILIQGGLHVGYYF